MSGPFRLYPQEEHWWSFNDYQAVLDVMDRLKPARVLEFGPGSSTLALIEGGASRIDTCEDDPEWSAIYRLRLVAKFPDVVRLHRYAWRRQLSIPALDSEAFDLALIDGPRVTARRVAVLDYALPRCSAVLLPLDDSQRMSRRLEQLATGARYTVELKETGPLAGVFALVKKVGP